jgi:tripartite-type tricarboxylate transporter receptor subunit TctC
MQRRSFLSAATVGVLGAGGLPRAFAQGAWPAAKPITLVVGYAPGGGVDFVFRSLAPHLSARLGQSVVIENKPGASAIIAAQYVSQAAPDGYTLFGTDGGAITLNGALYSKLPYDPATFAPISSVVRAPILIVANPAFPASDLAGLVAYAKRTGNLSYASPGKGTFHHIAMELLKRRAGFEAQDIAYKGAGPAVQDVVSGQVPVMPLDTVVGLPQIRAGKLKVLAVLTASRPSYLPDVATAAEQGVQGVEAYAWSGLVAPAAAPRDVVARLNTEVRAVLQMPEVMKRFQDLGLELSGNSPAEFQTYLDAEVRRMHPVIKQMNLRLD